MAKLAKFQQSGGAAAQVQPQPSTQQPPVQRSPIIIDTSRSSNRPVPPPLNKGTSGLNLVEIQRRIAEAKNRLSTNPAAAATVSFF